MYPYNIDTEEESRHNAPDTAALQTEKKQIRSHSHSQVDDRLLEMLNEAIISETADKKKYESLISQIDSPEDKEILRTIKMNSIKAEKLLKQIAMGLENEHGENDTIFEKTNSHSEKEGICEQLLECMFDCLKDVEFYRKLYFAFINLEIRDILFELISDNQSDSIKFLYLETKYRT